MEFVLLLTENKRQPRKHEDTKSFLRIFFRAFVSLRAFVTILLFWFWLVMTHFLQANGETVAFDQGSGASCSTSDGPTCHDDLKQGHEPCFADIFLALFRVQNKVDKVKGIPCGPAVGKHE